MCQSAAVTTPVNLSFPSLSLVSRNVIDFIATESIVVSAETLLGLFTNTFLQILSCRVMFMCSGSV